MLCQALTLQAESLEPSGTLPVLYINTDNNAPIVSKETYIGATCYLTVPQDSKYKTLGTPEDPVILKIRGRGNWTWGYFDKKPYRIKFDKKQEILGMSKDRNFALLAHADDDCGMLRNAVGFKLSSLLGLDYTPSFRPVEVVLNGDYEGLYMLTENIRVSKNRVNITEQADNDTVPENITGGWLVELDNYKDSAQISFPVTGTNLSFFNVTYHSPESLSKVQREYLYNQFSSILSTVFVTDKSSAEWESLIDVDELTKFYLVNEIIGNFEAFVGSCWIHKDRGQQKWRFGPVWDIGHAFTEGYEKVLTTEYNIFQMHPIIDEIYKFPSFQDKVREKWGEISPYVLDSLCNYIDTFAAYIHDAQSANMQRWPMYVDSDENVSAAFVKSFLTTRTAYLDSIWGNTSGIHNIESAGMPYKYQSGVYTIDGKFLSKSLDTSSLPRGIYIVVSGGKRKKVAVTF